jgi:hypothetical protein
MGSKLSKAKLCVSLRSANSFSYLLKGGNRLMGIVIILFYWEVIGVILLFWRSLAIGQAEQFSEDLASAKSKAG